MGNSLALLSGPDDEPQLIAQHVLQTLRAYVGEWAWDTSYGTDYLSIKGNGVSLESAGQMLRAVAMTIRGVVAVPRVECSRSWPDKKLTAEMDVQYATGMLTIVI